MIRISWGTGMAIVMSLFALMMAMFVVKAFSTTTALTTANPYADELRYSEEIIAGRQNLNALGIVPKLQPDAAADKMLLSVPLNGGALPQGRITFRHVSDPTRDISIPLETDAQGRQALPLQPLLGQRWSVLMSWTSGGKAYYYETAQVY